MQAVLGAGCVDLTPPWNNVSSRDGAGDLTGARGNPSGLADGAAMEGEVAVPDVEAGIADAVAKGETDLTAVDDSGGAVDGPKPDVTGVRDMRDDMQDGPRALDAGSFGDVPMDMPLGGAGGSTLDARRDVASGGQGGGGGIRTGSGGAGGISTGNGGGGGAGGGSGKGGAAGAGAGGSGIGGSGTGGAGGTPSIDAGSGRCTASQGLIAFYPCDQATGTSLPDLSGHNNHATLVTGTGGGAGYGLGAGKVGQALYLSAAQKGHATLPAGILASACEATVATWVFLNKGVLWQRIFDFGKSDSNGASTDYMYMAAEDDSPTKGLRFAISTTGLGPREQSVAGPALSMATWYHVAVVLGPSGGVLYLNGVQVGANPAMTLRPIDLSNPPNLFIGRSQWMVDPYFDGNIDEFRVYDRALAPAEIQVLASGS